MRITEVVVDQLHALEHRKLLVDALEGGARHRNSLDAMLFFWDESASVTEAVVKCMQFRPILMSFLFFEKSFSLLLVFYSFFCVLSVSRLQPAGRPEVKRFIRLVKCGVVQGERSRI